MKNLYRTVAISIPFALVFSSYASAEIVAVLPTPPLGYSGSATTTIDVSQTIQNPVTLNASYTPGLAVSAVELTRGKSMGSIDLNVDSGSISAVQITTANDYKLSNSLMQNINYCIVDGDITSTQQLCANDSPVAIFNAGGAGFNAKLNIVASADAGPNLNSGDFKDTLTVVVYTQ